MVYGGHVAVGIDLDTIQNSRGGTPGSYERKLSLKPFFYFISALFKWREIVRHFCVSFFIITIFELGGNFSF